MGAEDEAVSACGHREEEEVEESPSCRHLG